MDHELLKELKEAGFPAKHANIAELKVDGDGAASVKDGFFPPTLEKLIEACGDCRSFHLKFCKSCGEGQKPTWHAVLQIGDMPDHDWTSASTPIEAVARLWLALHANGDASA